MTTGPCQKSLFSFLVGPLQVREGCCEVTPEPSLLQPEQPQFSQLFLTGEVFRPSDSFCIFLCTHSSRSMSFLCWGLQSWMQDSRWGLTRAEQRSRIASLDLLATLLLMHPRMWLAFWAVSTNWWLMLSFCQPAPPSSSAQGCSQYILSPACICA